MKYLTVEQLLDKIGEVKLSKMSAELGEIRQKLVDLKKSAQHKGGLIEVTNSSDIIQKIDVHTERLEEQAE